MTLPDLTQLSLVQFMVLLLIVAAADTILGVIKAVAAKTFTMAKVAAFVQTHLLERVLPLFALGYVGGHGATFLGIDPIPVAWVAAAGGLAAYLIETWGSIRDTFNLPLPLPEPGANETPAADA